MGIKLETFVKCCINNIAKKQLDYTETSLSLWDTHTHCSLVLVKNSCWAPLNCQLACEMTPAAETSPLVIHCFNHCGSPNSCQPWQSLTHHCLLRALAPFVLFGTLSQTLCTIEIVGPALYGVGKMQHGRLNWCQNLYLVIPKSLEMALSYLHSSCITDLFGAHQFVWLMTFGSSVLPPPTFHCLIQSDPNIMSNNV